MLSHVTKAFLLLVFTVLTQADTYQPCPLLGPFFPEPSINASSPAIKDTFSSLTPLLDNYVAKGDGEFGPITPNTTSFSIALFAGSRLSASIGGSPILYEYRHEALDLQKKGADSLKAASVFAVGDLTQLITVYAQLIELGDQAWSTSIAEHLKELRNSPRDAITGVKWEEVNLGALAGQMSGVARNSNACSIYECCDRTRFLDALAKKRPVVLPDTTPIQSNAAFQLLALAMEEKVKKPLSTILNQRISRPLGLKDTNLLARNDSLFGDGLKGTSPSGEQAALGLATTIQDLSMIGHAMLGSKLLPPGVTRRWLKPFTSTSNLRNSVGRPWEIYHYGSKATDPVVDIYTKTGSIGRYSSYFGLAPSYDVGFAILAVDIETEAPDLNAYADVALYALLAVNRLGRTQANRTVSGTYLEESSDGNSSVIIGPALDVPGLAVTELIINGSNWLDQIASRKSLQPEDLDFRLYPTNLEQAASGPSGEVRRAYRAVLQDKSALVDAGTPTCISWQTVDELELDNLPLDEWVLSGSAGDLVESIEIPALGVVLRRST